MPGLTTGAALATIDGMRARKAMATYTAAMAALASQTMGAYIPAPPIAHFVRGSIPGPSDAATGLSTAGADQDTQTIYYTQPLSRFGKAHELGHLLDSEVLTTADRQNLERIMGFTPNRWGQQWNAGTGMAGLHSPNEVFADWYGNAAVGSRPGVANGSWQSAYADPPNAKQFRAFERWLVALGKQRQLKSYQR